MREKGRGCMTRSAVHEREENERLRPASQHFIPLHSFLSSLDGSYITP